MHLLFDYGDRPIFSKISLYEINHLYRISKDQVHKHRLQMTSAFIYPSILKYMIKCIVNVLDTFIINDISSKALNQIR